MSEYLGEAFHLGDRRYLIAHPDKPPYIIDMKTGQTEELEMPKKPTGGYGSSTTKPSTKKGGKGAKGGKK